MNYIITQADTSKKLEGQVNAMIDKGYRPTGGVSVALWEEVEPGPYPSRDVTYQRFVWCQAMIKSEASND